MPSVNETLIGNGALWGHCCFGILGLTPRLCLLKGLIFVSSEQDRHLVGMFLGLELVALVRRISILPALARFAGHGWPWFAVVGCRDSGEILAKKLRNGPSESLIS